MYKDSLLHPVREAKRCSTVHRPHMETEISLPSSQKQFSLMAKLCKGKGKTAWHYRQSVWFGCFCSHVTFSQTALSSDRVRFAATTEILHEKLQGEIRPIVVFGRHLCYTDRQTHLTCQARSQRKAEQNRLLTTAGPSVRPRLIISTEQRNGFLLNLVSRTLYILCNWWLQADNNSKQFTRARNVRTEIKLFMIS
jgi:hypothetical protein